MKKRKVCCTVIVLLIMQALTTSLAQNNQGLNLYDMTFNGIALDELTIEKITDIFGRPTATNKFDILPKYTSSTIFYHNLGLTFEFYIADGKLKSMMLYLGRKWDKENSEFFQSYSGKITPYLNLNMKINALNQLFNNYACTTQSAEERRKEYQKATRGLNMSSAHLVYDCFSVKNNRWYVNIFGEEVTKFLEYLAIVLNDNSE
jgi:hypothetical protein